MGEVAVVQTSPLTVEAARALTDEIRVSLSVAYDKLILAWRGRAAEALGYESWEAYCAAEFTQARMIRLPIDQRREITAQLRQEGMSTPAIGSALGVGRETVRTDLQVLGDRGVELPATITATDGHPYPATRPRLVSPPPTPEEQEDEARRDLYTKICEQMQSLSLWGGYAEIDRLMADYDVARYVHPPQIALTEDTVTKVRRFCDLLLEWLKGQGS